MAKLIIATDAIVVSNPATILAQVDIVQSAVAKIRTAFGHFDNSIPPVWIDATSDDVIQALKSFMKGRYIEHQSALSANATRDTTGGETW